MKILYVSDLDGTLLNKDSMISRKTIDIINALVEKGMYFTFATARSISSAYSITKDLHLRTPLIVYNGAFLIDPYTYFPIYQKFFKTNDAKELLDLLLKNHRVPFVYAIVDGKERVSYMHKNLHEGALHYMSKRKNDKRFRCVATEDKLYEGSIFYITCIDDYKNLSVIYEQVKEYSAYQSLFHQELFRDEYWLECMPSSVSKANAVMHLKEQEGFDYIVSFGDAINDLPLFQISDEAYAVENAIDELKSYATKVIKGHDEDAVALWLQEHFT